MKYLMLRTKLWFVTHVAIEITPNPISEAKRMSAASCSRMGMRNIVSASIEDRLRDEERELANLND